MPATHLFATTSAEEHWRAVARPWLRAQAAAAWREERPTVVLTPGRAEGFYLRGRLVEEGVPLLGVRFWTPSDARNFLLAHFRPQTGAATQAELRLLARAEAADASGQSVVREPGAFLRAYDLLLGAGWDPALDGASYGRELSRRFTADLKKAGIATQAGLHRELLRAAHASSSPPIAGLLVTGFNATHWPLWDLLKAAVLSAENVVAALAQPGVFAGDVDRLWNSSWEDFTGTVAIIPELAEEIPAAPFSALAASYETGSRERLPSLDVSFCVAPDVAAQTRGVVLRALDFLRRDECTRLGIVFPQANALALGVAEELRRRGILMNDGPGVLTPGTFERRSWQAWLALQEEPGVAPLIAWLRACDAEGRSFSAMPGLTAERLAAVLQSALGETLVDDLEFLARHLEGNTRWNDACDAAAFLRARTVLPAEGTFPQFMDLTRSALDLPGWETQRAELAAEPPAWLARSRVVLSRRTFLEWLRDTTNSQARTRGPHSNHFYGKVHLLVYGQLAGQTWSHLILTGQNEGVWPRVFEAGAFGSRYELEALNRQARDHNRRVQTAGAHGEGEEIVRAGFGHCLLPLERRDLALRDLCAALESAQAAVCLAAMSTEAGRGLLPSDFFNHAYQAAMGRVLDEDAFRQMANATLAWTARHACLFEAPANASPPDLETFHMAHEARRDAGRPFGAYEFAFAEAPENPIQLRCKQWEDAWRHPATVWLGEVVGAGAWPDGALNWPGAIGTWAHDWLAQALKETREHGVDALRRLVEEAAERTARRVRQRAADAEFALYPWWEQVWSRARSVALGLAEGLKPVLPGRAFEAEYRIPPGCVIALPGAPRADFALKGRLDLVLFKPGAAPVESASPAFAGADCWVVDFKTGAAKALSAKDAVDGRGLQALLYGCAVRALGGTSVRLSLLTRGAQLKEQVDLDAMPADTPLFRSLELMHRGGIFGMRPDAENEYGFSPEYPLATRFIPRHVLEAKWALVHGGQPREGEEEE
jgi:hypothetical protein